MIEAGEPIAKAARRVVPVFSGERLMALRELHGMSQAAVAEAAGITPSALSQAERGNTTLKPPNIAKVARLFGVMPDAFAERPEPDFAMEPQFRHLRRTPTRERRRSERFIRAAALVAANLRSEVRFPEVFEFTHDVDPDKPVADVADQIETAAALTRDHLGIARDEPIGTDLLHRLEAGGIIVVRDPLTDDDIDAYSAVVDRLPVIVLDGGERSVWDRDDFNLAHETGHLVMHRGITHRPGTKNVESQAHRFAGALLGPADALRHQLPTDLDWGRYLELKRRWGLSMFALVRRAKDLEVIDDATYVRAMKQRSAHGWRFVEPGANDHPLPAPRLLSLAASLAQITTADLARRTHLPEEVVERILGRQQPSLIDY